MRPATATLIAGASFSLGALCAHYLDSAGHGPVGGDAHLACAVNVEAYEVRMQIERARGQVEAMEQCNETLREILAAERSLKETP